MFSTGYSLNIRLAACVAAGLALLTLEQHGTWQGLRLPFAALIYPLQQAVSSPVHLVRKAIDTVSTYTDLAAENQRLRDEQLVLKTKLLKFAALEQENIRLRGLLDTSFKVGEQVLIAELLSINLVPYEHVVVVNKGSRFGVHPQQAVFDGNGVVGQVLRVTPQTAEVMLITDPSHAIPVQINRNGLRTIALGTGQIDRLALPYLPSNADVQVGDLLVTSGMGGVFPQGYPVAKVTGIAPQKSPFAKISAVPVAQLDRNRELLLVWSDSQPIPRIPEAVPNPPPRSPTADARP
ncbi:rod shape-determining protein MreC [Methylomagnum ishizawai]|uniref:rod shape-determining protein MreC n=1 Tax=Methylomagnum ishizawai TaxID=1760988 RepID=UPI001C823868|nr:rod shape-determining protein MreC [Methylomagnum ishizawai]